MASMIRSLLHATVSTNGFQSLRLLPRLSINQLNFANIRFLHFTTIKTDYSSNRSSVCTVYDPTYGGTVTRRVTNQEKNELESNMSSLDDVTADLDRVRTYGSDRKDASEVDVSVKDWKNVNLKTTSLGNGYGIGDVGGGSSSKRKGKAGRVSWICTDCGNTFGKWWGACNSCGSFGTIKEFSEAAYGGGGADSGAEGTEKMVQTWLPYTAGDVKPLRLTDVNRRIQHCDWRIPLPGPFGSEVSRVLGGGLAPGSLVLVGGDPGVGKSTLMLQIAGLIAEGREGGESAPVVYVSGEESIEQIANRADRMGIEAQDLFLYSSTDIEDILEKAHNLFPRALVVDSIQTAYLKGVTGSPGGIQQVKECTSAMLRFAKKTNVPVFLIGHVTKSGEIAGPRVLEHIVDVVLYMEGEKYSSHRLLRPVKNRFGSTDELGVLEMSQSGLQAVANPSGMFLSEHNSDSEVLAGLAVAVVMDASRSFLIEVQALCVADTTVSRHINGVQSSRADMIISVLTKQAGLKLQENAIFLNVVSGAMLKETAGDLAIAAAICSSFMEFPIPNDVAFIGEIGLAGELHTVPRMEKRVNTVAKLGYKTCIVPKTAEKSLAILGDDELKIIGCKNLKEVINHVFR